MFRRTALAATALLAALTLAITGCGPGEEPAPAPSGKPNASASVAIRLALAPSNLDIRTTAGVAVDQVLIDNVYQGLVSRTPDQKIVPALASDWEVSPDGLTYTFTLEDGVVFHDGQELTADDVVWSLTTRKNTPEWSESDRLARVSEIAAEGQTVTLTLTEPDSSLMWNLTGRAGIILKTDDTVNYQTDANGTGPFMVANWKEGDSVTLTRFEDYWGDPAQVAEVVFPFITDTQAAINAALAGEVDVVTGFEAPLTEQITAEGTFTVTTGSATDKSVLAMNSTAAPLDDERVRQALRMAIDHDAIVSAIGSGSTLFGPIPKPDPGYQDLSEVISFDPAAAKELLAEANAEDLTLTLTTPSFYPPTAAQILVSNFDEIGITLKVESVEFATWINDVYKNQDYQLSLINHAEPRDFENWANPDYYFTYDNPEVQELYQQSLASTDEDESAQLLAKAAKTVSEDHAADWLYNWASVVAVGTNISGMPIDNVNSRINLAEISKR